MHWTQWYRFYVDDAGVTAQAKRNMRFRCEIFEDLMWVLDKPFSDKTDENLAPGEFAESMEIAGLFYTAKGYRMNDAAFKAITYTCTQYEVKTKEDVQHVVGSLIYMSTGFCWRNNHNYARFSELIGICNKCVDPHAGQKSKVDWGDEQRAACLELMAVLKKQPYAYFDPDTMLDDDHCLIAITDASDTAVGACLFIVKKPCAREVTIEHLHDHSLTQIVAVSYKRLNDQQKKWNTFEAELYGVVRIVTTWGKYITVATREYLPHDSATGKQWDAKIGILSDSQTGIGQWRQMQIPSGMVDYLSAKKRRFYSWSDKCSGTKYWPLCINYLPGPFISLPHILSHVGDLCAQRHEELEAEAQAIEAARTAVGLPMTTCMVLQLRPSTTISALPVQRHSYHDEASVRNHTSVPEQHTVQHLQLQHEQVQEVQRAMRDDKTTINSVRLCDIHAVLSSSPTAADVAMDAKRKITAWAGTQFFWLQVPVEPQCDETCNMIYTTASAQVLAWSDDDERNHNATRLLVPVIPKGTAVKLTTAQAVGTQDVAEEGEHWMDHDLRRDLMWLCHDLPAHAGKATMARNLRQLAWWPNMTASINEHVSTCSHCIQRVRAYQAVGVSMMSASRFKVLLLDHWDLPPELWKTGYKHIFTMVDMATRFVVFVKSESTDAAEAVRLLWTHWIAYFSMPGVMRTDGGPAFASELMGMFRALTGIAQWDKSAPGNPEHHAILETKHNVIADVIDQARGKGDAGTPAQLDMYCAVAMQKCNHGLQQQGITAFERTTGEQPSQIHELVKQVPKFNENQVQPQHRDIVKQINQLVQNLFDWSLVQRDEETKHDVLRRTAKNAEKRAQTHDLRAGDQASYKGDLVTIIEHVQTKMTATGPTKTVIKLPKQDGSIQTKTVSTHDLTRCASPRPEHVFTKVMPLAEHSVGEFIIFDSNEARAAAGVIKNIHTDENMYEIQLYGATAKQPEEGIQRRWAPMWEVMTGKYAGETIIQKSQPNKRRYKTRAVQRFIQHNAIITAGHITSTGCIDDAVLASAQAQGVSLTVNLATQRNATAMHSENDECKHVMMAQTQEYYDELIDCDMFDEEVYQLAYSLAIADEIQPSDTTDSESSDSDNDDDHCIMQAAAQSYHNRAEAYSRGWHWQRDNWVFTTK